MKNKLIKLMLAFTIAFTVFACEIEGNNEEITKIPTIVDIAKADLDLSSLVQALTVTGLAPTFTAPGSYTVFAPSNASFSTAGVTPAYLKTIEDAIAASKLPAPNTVAIPAPIAAQISSLRLILQYHVLGIASRSEDLLLNLNLNFNGYSRTLSFYKSLPIATSGANLSMFIDTIGSDVVLNGGSTNGGSKISLPNIIASNGIIHKIDNVLSLPTVVSHVKANPKVFSTLLTILSGTSAQPGIYGDQSAILNTLVAAVGELDPSAAVTVYAPSNTAFATATATGGFLTNSTFFGTPALTSTNVTKVLRYHVNTGNSTSNSATSWVNANTVFVNSLIRTLLAVSPPTTPASFQRFSIERGTVKITELPVQIGVPASNIKTVNIQATNGVIHTIDRVLQPVL